MKELANATVVSVACSGSHSFSKTRRDSIRLIAGEGARVLDVV